MNTKFDAFNNEYIEINNSSYYVNDILHFVRHYVVRQIKCVRNNENNSRYNASIQTIVVNIIHFIVEHECKRYYIDDLRDDVYTYFHQYD